MTLWKLFKCEATLLLEPLCRRGIGFDTCLEGIPLVGNRDSRPQGGLERKVGSKSQNSYNNSNDRG